MEASRATKAIILSRQDYRENDSLAVFYTLDFGRLSLVARGVKKSGSKLAGHLEPFSLVDLMIIPGRGLDYVGSLIIRENFFNLKQDLNSLYFAGQGLIWFKKLTGDNQPDEALYYLFYNYLKILDELDVPLDRETGELIFAFFIVKFLSLIGYEPQLGRCLSCHQAARPGKNYFNLKDGGLVCAACFNNDREKLEQEFLVISDNCVKLLRLMITDDLRTSFKVRAEKKLIKEMANLIKGFLNFRV